MSEPREDQPRLIKMESTGPAAVVDLDKSKTVVIIPFAPIEYHGDHLPLCTDLVVAESIRSSSAGAFLDANKDWSVLAYPVIPLAADLVPHLSSVPIPHRLIYKMALKTADNFLKKGFKNIVLLSGHGGFTHDYALEKAAKKLNRRFKNRGAKVIAPLGKVMFELMSPGFIEKANRLLTDKISAAEGKDLAYEPHAGWWETSMVLAHKPDLINADYLDVEDYRPKIKPSVRVLLKLIKVIAPKRFTPKIAEAEEVMLVGISWFWGDLSKGYLGFPRLASVERGEVSARIIGEAFADVYQDIFIRGGDAEATESVYSLLDVLIVYGIAAGAAAVLLVIGYFYIF